MGALTLMKEFSGWTSAHGIPQIGSARNWPVRIIWFIIFLCALGMFVYQMQIIVSTFLQYGVVVATTVEYARRDFPAVTVCNKNAYKLSKVTADPDASALLVDYEEAMISATGTVSGADKFGFNMSMAYVASTWTSANRGNYSYAATDIILECEFAHGKCSAADFTLFMDPIYGQCYQFNNDAVNTRFVTEPGPEFGLRLLLYSAQSEYVAITDTATFKVSVHPAKQEPFVDAFGYNMAMGYVNQVAIKQFGNSRLAEPYGNCTNATAGNTFYYDTDEYSMEGCFRSCYQEFIVEQCACADPRFAKLAASTWCTPAELPCVLALRQAQLDDAAGAFDQSTMCSCPQRCEDMTYSAVIHQQWWPAEMYAASSCALWAAHLTWNDTDYDVLEYNQSWTDCRNLWHENSMRVEVYFDTLISTDLTESPAYTISDIVFNFGGQIGLWMGFSAITMIEWVGLAILIGMACCAKVRGPSAITDNDIHKKDMDDIDHIIDKAYDSDDDGASSSSADSSSDSSVDPYGDGDDAADEPPPIAQ